MMDCFQISSSPLGLIVEWLHAAQPQRILQHLCARRIFKQYFKLIMISAFKANKTKISRLIFNYQLLSTRSRSTVNSVFDYYMVVYFPRGVPEPGTLLIPPSPLTSWHQQLSCLSPTIPPTMGSSPFTMRSILTLFLLVVQLACALKFDLPANSGKNERCIRNFVSKDQLVVVTAIVSGQKGDGQKVNMHVRTIFTGES